MGRGVTGLGAVRAVALDVLDLALPATCAGCAGEPGLLCAACRLLLAGPARAAWPDPTPVGLPPPWAVAAYAGAVRDIVVAHKEHGRRALAQPLGAALAVAVRAALAGCPVASGSAGRASGASSPGRVVLVPMPSRAAAVRARGRDPTLATARVAAQELRRDGHRVAVLPVLRLARSVTDQAGLDATARAANLAGAVLLPGRFQRLLGRLRAQEPCTIVLADDIITTGSSLTSAAATLRRAGAPVAGAALVAATPRRTAPRTPR